MNSLDEIEKIIMENTNKSDRIIQGIWSVDCLFNPSNNGRIFDYKFIVAQSLGQGCAYSTNLEYSREYLRNFIGKDFAKNRIEDIAMRVALYDSVFGNIVKPRNYTERVMRGFSSEKLKWRTEIVLAESKRLVGGLKNKKVVNVGVVGDFIKTFAEEGAYVVGTDFDESIIGKNLFENSDIVYGTDTLKEIKDADIAVVTGMTITTQTIDDIIKCCKKNNVKLIVFAETGANLAGYYIGKGVDVYLSEYFPFYIYNGISVIDICYSSV